MSHVSYKTRCRPEVQRANGTCNRNRNRNPPKSDGVRRHWTTHSTQPPRLSNAFFFFFFGCGGWVGLSIFDKVPLGYMHRWRPRPRPPTLGNLFRLASNPPHPAPPFLLNLFLLIGLFPPAPEDPTCAPQPMSQLPRFDPAYGPLRSSHGPHRLNFHFIPSIHSWPQPTEGYEARKNSRDRIRRLSDITPTPAPHRLTSFQQVIGPRWEPHHIPPLPASAHARTRRFSSWSFFFYSTMFRSSTIPNPGGGSHRTISGEPNIKI